MLINEFYKVTTSLTNNSDSDLKNVGATISLPTSLLHKVFLVVDEPSACSKLSSRIQIDVGEMKGRASASISYFITSMVEGNIELKQSLCYQIEDKSAVDDASMFIQASSPSDPSINIEKCFVEKEDHHDVLVEYLENSIVRKKRDDILIIPCVEEFHFESKFYTLNRKQAKSCFKGEDIIMRCTLKMTSPFSIDIEEAFFIADVNVDELRNQNQNFIKQRNERGAVLENLVVLRPNCNSVDWLTRETFKNPFDSDASKLFEVKSIEKDRRINQVKEATKENEDDPFVLKSKEHKLNFAKSCDVVKTIVRNTLDATELVDQSDKLKGFIKGKIDLLQEKSVDPARKFGMYCIKWRKIDSDVVNESKFLIKGIGEIKSCNQQLHDFHTPSSTGVTEPLLNIYSDIQDRVFVREFFTYKIILKNPHSSLLNMVATFNVNTADGFMFAGHRQVNITILSYSQFELSFNLYPLKANYQRLPELKLELAISSDEIGTKEQLEAAQRADINQKQTELNELLSRWLPKSVFVHVSLKLEANKALMISTIFIFISAALKKTSLKLCSCYLTNL